MRTLILSCSTGQGHNSVAKAIKNVFDARDQYCEIVDALSFISPRFAKFMDWGHATMYRKIPVLFKLGYRFSENHDGSFKEGSPAWRMLTSGSKPMAKYIKDGGFDNIICTHNFPGIMLEQALKKMPMDVYTSMVATDYTCSPGMKDSNLHRCYIPAKSLTSDFTRGKITADKILATGIPVRQDFYTCLTKTEARDKLGLPTDCRHAVMMSGSMGCGPMADLAVKLAETLPDGCHVTVICGTNEKLYEELSGKLSTYPHMHVLGFTKDISTLMDSADLYLTKPGGISVTEAAAKKLPMVLIQAVAGCEEYNRDFFLATGGAVTAKDTDGLAELCRKLLTDDERLKTMSNKLADLSRFNGAKRIYSDIAAHFAAKGAMDEFNDTRRAKATAAPAP